MNDVIDYRSYTLSNIERKRYFAVFAVIALGVSLLFYHNPIVAVPIFVCSFPFKKVYERQMAGRRRQQLSMQFKDLLTSLSASFATGRMITEALIEAHENLEVIYDETAVMQRELAVITQRLTAGRESEKVVMYDFADRSACEDISNFVDVYFTCLTTGGDINKAVARAADQIADKIDIKKDIYTQTAQKKFEAKIMTGLPVIILLFLQVTSPDYLNALYHTSLGAIIMTFAVLLIAAAYLWASRITELDV